MNVSPLHGFGQPVRINVAALREIFEKLADPRFRRPLTAADDPTQARDVESGTIRMSQNGAQHDRRKPGTRQLLVGNRLQYAFNVEIAVNTKRASDPQHCDARQVECTDVVKRTCHQQAVILIKPKRNDMIDAFPVEIIVGVHHAFRPIGGAGRVHQAEQFVRFSHMHWRRRIVPRNSGGVGLGRVVQENCRPDDLQRRPRIPHPRIQVLPRRFR